MKTFSKKKKLQVKVSELLFKLVYWKKNSNENGAKKNIEYVASTT